LQIPHSHRDNFCTKLLLVPSSRAEEYISSLNLFIYLIADYYSQKDLVVADL
jgi:hypothetical protein